ncbi:hypothetical protein PIB30_058381, partial [Stylosanthes scabra]|nr:hypothetical protein [Stylosanthes scabra]
DLLLNPTLAEAVWHIKKRKQQEKEERNNKKAKQPNEGEHQCQVQEDAPIGSSEHEHNAVMFGFATVSLGRDDSDNLIVDGPPITASQSSIHPEPEPPQQKEQPSQQPHPEEVIDISSSSEDEHQPTARRVFFSLIPKVEEEQTQEEEQPPKQPPQQEENPPIDEEQHLKVEESIYPKQEVIDISSSSDNEHEPTPIQVLIPKVEVDHVSSPRAKIITDVLLSMNQEYPLHSEPDHAPSFDLGIDYGTEPHQT